MTRIILENSRTSHAVRALGHATPHPGAPPCRDQAGARVCAAVSALLYALGGWLSRRGRADDIVWLEEGDALLFSSDPDPRTAAAFAVTAEGLGLLAGAFPAHIRVEDWTKPDKDGPKTFPQGTRPHPPRRYTGQNAGEKPGRTQGGTPWI